MKQSIAERKLFYRSKGSSNHMELTIRIGIPYIDENGMAKCPIEWDGLFENYADIGGVDLLHALQLASDVDSMLKKLQHKYDFYWSTGEPYFEDD